MKRAQCFIVRENKILMVQQKDNDTSIWLLPGGRIEEHESPEQAALRELHEECNVAGTIVRMISFNDYSDAYQEYTYHVDIGSSTISQGSDPEKADQEIMDVQWKDISELTEMERGLLWSSGLLAFMEIINDYEEHKKTQNRPL
ncbi:MAG: NUDIX hydrolase [Spirochaetes bacterium]|nr:NUDIX hydrolase [Spirochaetota bacterium]